MSEARRRPRGRFEIGLLRIVGHHLKKISFLRLTRPRGLPNDPPSRELLNWAIAAYAFPWLRHFESLISGIVVLNDSGHRAAVRIVGRSSYQLCAHVYYVKKHLKQHLDLQDLVKARDFLLPITSGSRYVNDLYPDTSGEFPTGAHISKAVKCFQEVMPKDSLDDYSYLSEYCHPHMMAFMQDYQWTSPNTIDFAESISFGAFGAITSSAIQGLLAVQELLQLGHENTVRKTVVGLLNEIAERGKTLYT